MDWKMAGALAFGVVIGWFVYYVNRYRKGDVQIGDITTIIGAIGGGAVLALFDRSADLFGSYAIGLAIGFFLYFFILVILVGVSDNFDSDWFLDGRRRDPAPGFGFGHDRGSGVAMAPRPEMAAPAPVAAPASARMTAAPSGVEEDPARPVVEDGSEIADFESLRIIANLGLREVEQAVAPAPAPAGPAQMPIDIAHVRQFLDACMTSHPRVTYGLGAKVPFHGAVPGADFTKVDCSGFVREAIRLATNPQVAFPDGSVVQHDWVRSKGFLRVPIADGGLNDNRVRIAFLRPQDSPSHIGHVVLISGGRTFESHGGVGPDTRAWTGQGWQAKAFVYRLN